MTAESLSRRKVVGMVGGGMTMMIAGCASDEGGTSTEMADSISLKTIGAAPKAFSAIAENYNQYIDGEVDFNISGLGPEELNTNLLSAITAGSGGPDIATPQARQTPSFIGTGGLVDFEDRMSKEDTEVFVDWRWDTLSDDQGRGRYGLPIDVAPVGTLYNRSIYEEYGFSPSDLTTYQDFINAAQEVDDNINLMTIGGDALAWRWIMLVRQQDGQIYDENGRLMINTSETRRAADLIKRLYDSGAAANISAWSESWTTGLNEGKIATVTRGVWMTELLKSSLGENHKGNWGIQKPPAVTENGNRATNNGGSNIIIPSHINDSKIDRAWDFMKFAFANETQAMTYAREAGVIPANQNVYNNDYWKEPQEYFGGDTLEMYLELAPNIPSMRMITVHREIQSRMGDFLANYCVEEEYNSAEEMAEDAEQTIASEVDRETA